MTRVRGLRLALVAAVLTVAADRVTKFWAEHALVAGPCRPGGDECIELVGSLRLHLVYNQGAAFSTGTGMGPVFGLVAAVMTVVLLRLAATARDRIRALLFGLIAGGAVGNLIDRVVRAEDGLLSGAVIDFVDLQWWPVFNVADSAVVVGVVAFVLHSLRQPDHPMTEEVPADGAADAPGDGPPAGHGSGRDVGDRAGAKPVPEPGG